VFPLDGMISEDHPVRSIWAFVKGADLSRFHEELKSLGVAPGGHRSTGMPSWPCGCRDDRGRGKRASAATSSLRRKKTPRECLRQAKERGLTLCRDPEEDHGAATRRQQAARERAAQDRADRALKALERAREPVKERPKKKDKEAGRTLTTDPQARVMKMGDGGQRTADNVQLATNTANQNTTGVDVTNQGNGQGRSSR